MISFEEAVCICSCFFKIKNKEVLVEFKEHGSFLIKEGW